MRFSFILGIFTIILPLRAQLAVSTASANQMATILMPPSFQIHYANHQGAVGKFTGTSDLNLHGLGSAGQGILLTSGTLTGSQGPQGPNDQPSAGENTSATLPTQVQEWLIGEVGQVSFYDPSFLSFQFSSPTNATLTFQYIFGSEEYHEFVNSGYKDVFAIFIESNFTDSVPEIRNIAKVPGTDLPISINTINDGYSGNCQSNGNNGVNSQFFFDNCEGHDIQYDGFTKALEATINISAQNTYRIWFVICDVHDGNFDSGAFIKLHSFEMSSEETPVLYSSVYPNPCTGRFTLTNITEKTEITVTNSNGQTILQQVLAQSDAAEIILDEFPAGIYFLTQRTETHINTTKILIQK